MKLSIIPSEKYPRHELEVQDWIAKEKGIYNRQKSKIEITSETFQRKNDNGSINPGAYKIKFVTGIQEVHSIPKSQCKIIERKEVSLNSWS